MYVPGVELKALQILGEHSTTELYLQPKKQHKYFNAI
jgi:hypothetical protein